MNELHAAVDAALQPYGDYEFARRYVVRTIMSAKGIDLTDEQIGEMLKEVDSGKPFVCEGVGPGDGIVNITFEQSELDDAVRKYGLMLQNVASHVISETAFNFAPVVAKDLRRNRSKLLKALSDDHTHLEGVIQEFWGNAIGRLTAMINVCREVADDVNRNRHTDAKYLKGRRSRAKWLAVSAIHTRACRTAMAIVALLKAGFADDAMARWRSLHELAVIAMFLNEESNNTSQRYLDHAMIEQYRAARVYQEHCEILGYKRMTTKEMNALEAQQNKLVDIYGKDYGRGDYGWAAASLKMAKPTFANIEQRIDLDHWRPFYKLACHSVHGGAHACKYSLGSYDGGIESSPTVAGLCDPGRSCAMSLTMTTVAMLTVCATVDRLLACNVVSILSREAENEFAKAERKVMKYMRS